MEELPGLTQSLAQLRQTFRSGRTRGVDWRKAQLQGILKLVSDNEEKIFGALQQDLGKHPVESYRDEVEPVRNLFAALFLASIGMLIHVHFLWIHIDILLAAVILVIIVKTIVVAVVVKGFGYGSKTSILVGMSLAQIGEFAFVLLSRASQLGKLYMLLLGTTALSLVTTPLLFKLIPAAVHLGVLLRLFSPNHLSSEIGIKGDILRAESARRVSLMCKDYMIHQLLI